MVPPSKKRKLQGGAEPKGKRRPQTSKASKNKNTSAAVPRHRVTDSKALAWQSVGEEFGGLQVIEGVDVVRNGDQVSFLVADEAVNHEEMQQDDEPFEGFSDDDVEMNEDEKKDGSEQKQKQNKAKKANDKADAVPEKKTKAAEKTNLAEKTKTTEKAAEKNTKATKADELDNNRNQNKKGAIVNSFEALDGMNEEDDTDMEQWAALGLSPRILSAIAKLGFAQPTTIQEKTIPDILRGNDVIGKAQTGSGKTLAFGIPAVERWLESQDQGRERKGPMALVLSPTRELAKQLGDHIKALCDGLPSAPYVCVVTGGLSIQKQQRQLEKADIVIGTPGRLWEVLDGDMKLQNEFTKIQFLIVDEADRLFKAGQFKEAELIIGALDRPEDARSEDSDDEGQKGHVEKRQTLVFSATFDKDLQTKLAGKGRPSSTGSDLEKMAYLMKCIKFHTRPTFIDANPVTQMAEGLREGLVECGAMEKVRKRSMQPCSDQC